MKLRGITVLCGFIGKRTHSVHKGGVIMARNKYKTHVEPNLALIKSLRRDGQTEEQIYKRLDVGHTAWNDYKNKHADLSEALKTSKESLIAKIEESLFTKALEGNMTAIIFSLKNLAPSKWKDKREISNDEKQNEEFLSALGRFTEAIAK